MAVQAGGIPSAPALSSAYRAFWPGKVWKVLVRMTSDVFSWSYSHGFNFPWSSQAPQGLHSTAVQPEAEWSGNGTSQKALSGPVGWGGERV